jgi:hypothetical protein
MHTGRVIATGVLHGCDHTYIAYVVGTIICIYPLHTVAKIGPLGGGRFCASEKGS